MIQSAAIEWTLICGDLMLGYMRTTELGGGAPMMIFYIKGLYVEWRCCGSATPMLRFDASNSFHLGIGRLELVCDWFHRSNESNSGIDG